MKSYRLKSLLYFACFLAAAVFYYNFEQDNKVQNDMLSASVADTQLEDTTEEIYTKGDDVLVE